jgi:uncharacterized protein (UPF0147 family)
LSWTERGRKTGGAPSRNTQVARMTPLLKNRAEKGLRKAVVLVAKYDELSKDEKIKKEIRRLNQIYKNIPKNEKAVIEGLIRRAAYMRITLEEMEEDLNTNGYTELFTQSEKVEPYERERPVARLYNAMNKNYQTIMKQLAEFVEKEPALAKEQSDGFEEFVNGRGE